MTARFPHSIESVDCDWLTHVLHRSGQLGIGKITEFDYTAIDEGYTSSLYRVRPGYDVESAAGPASMVLKFHSASKNLRGTFEALGIYEKEVRFYQFIDPDLELPVPRCFAAEFDEASGNFVLLLQDLSLARSACWDPDPIDDIRIALPQLARIHAQFWDDRQLAEFPWVVQPTQAPESDVIKRDWRKNLSCVKAEFADLWPVRHWSACDRILEKWDSLMACINRDSHTLVHTDSHLGQMFFPTDELPNFFLLDWQYPSQSLASEDVTHLIANELTPEQRQAHESGLFHLYFDALCQYGVSNLSYERFLFQCRLSLMWLLLMNFRTVAEPDLRVILIAEAEDSDENWEDWIFSYLGSALDDWKFADVLEQAISEGQQILR